MPSPRHGPLRFPAVFRAVTLSGVVALLAGCTSSVAGSAVPAATAVASSSAPTSAGQITQPSVLPGQSRSASSGSSAPSASAAPNNPAPMGTGTPPGPVPKGLERFYTQKLAWGACGGYATDTQSAQLYASPTVSCARMTVPLAYADPAGKTIQVAVLRKVALDPAARIGSLIMDPGGPGGSGMSFLASLVVASNTGASSTTDAQIAQLNKTFDLVGIDPRGVGSSLPAVHCQTDAQRDATRAINVRSRNQADVNAANAITKQIVAGCLANTGTAQGIDSRTFLANVGTRDVARDLDVLRAVLGDAKLTYAGFSYGTEIGWEYAEQFPSNVRALLFDGDVSPIEDPATSALSQAAAFERAFAAFTVWCAKSSPGCALGTDPAASLARYQALVRPLLTNEVPLRDGRVLSFADAVSGTSDALYATPLWTYLAKGLLNLSLGSGDLLMALADDYAERDSTGHYSNLLEAFNAVRCVDGPRMSNPAEVTKFNAAYAAAAPFEASGDPPGAVVDICADWPVPPTLLPHRLNITGLPRTLVISTTGDPATPYADGVELAKEIGGTLLTAKAVRHTSYLLNGDSCVDKIGTAYLVSLTLPATGATCA